MRGESLLYHRGNSDTSGNGKNKFRFRCGCRSDGVSAAGAAVIVADGFPVPVEVRADGICSHVSAEARADADAFPASGAAHDGGGDPRIRRRLPRAEEASQEAETGACSVRSGNRPCRSRSRRYGS